MKTKSTIFGSLVAGILIFAAASHAVSADVLFTSTPYGPLGYDEGSSISGSYGQASSFEISSASTVTSIDLSIYSPGDNISTIGWAITSTPFAAVETNPLSSYFSGTIYADNLSTSVTQDSATAIDAPSGGNVVGAYNEYTDSFSTGPVALSAGTYYLNIGLATTADSSTPLWESTDYGNSGGYDYPAGYTTLPNEFSVIGSPAPEASSFTGMLLGLSGLGAFAAMVTLRKRKESTTL